MINSETTQISFLKEMILFSLINQHLHLKRFHYNQFFNNP